MPITLTHIIRQQYLHVAVNGTESDGLALQRRLPGLCQNWLIPAIDRVLERCAPVDGHLYIERLELDAGNLTLERLEYDLAEVVAQALEKSLREHILPGESPPPIISGNIQHKTAQSAIQEAFIYFLRYGSLPWSFRLPEGGTLEQVILASWQEGAKSDLCIGAVNDALLYVIAAAAVRKRLIGQFSPVFLETLLSLLSPEGKKVMGEVLQILRRADVPPGEIRHFEKQLWETVFAKVAARTVMTARDLVGEVRGALPMTAPAGHTALAGVLERHWPDVTHKATAGRVKINEPIPPTLPGSDKTLINGNEHREAGEGIDSELIPQDRAEVDKTPVTGSEHPDAAEGIYIENAGLVLLHPFLPRFFDALGIAAEDELLQPERALCLLHFLTTGQPSAPEYELVLPKILCNIPLHTPVETDVELTELEKEEAVALLEAVIRHWEVLQNTSPDGLRGTFLLRPGKVSLRDDGGWLLQVETKAFDILLDQLPWGISMIKLPWMEQMLWVEWR